MNFELLRFEKPAVLAEAVAAQWLAEASIPHASDNYCVALAGGRIARDFFQAITNLVQAGKGSVKNVHFFWGDERCVPPDDAESNFRLAQEHMLGPLAAPEDHVHRIRGEIDPQVAAEEATGELRRFAGAQRDDQPVLDVVFLGLGENGHTASLFPEEPDSVRNSPSVYRPVIASSKPPPRRITLGYPAIVAARQVWVLASGLGKEKALRDSLSPGEKTPLGRVLSRRVFSRIFSDIPGTSGATR